MINPFTLLMCMLNGPFYRAEIEKLASDFKAYGNDMLNTKQPAEDFGVKWLGTHGKTHFKLSERLKLASSPKFFLYLFLDKFGNEAKRPRRRRL